MNAPEIIMQAATGYWLSRCVHVVAGLGVADHVEDTPKSVASVAEAVGANGAALSRVFRLLSAHGIFELRPEGVAHSDASRLLRSDNPQSLRPYAQMIGSKLCWDSYGLLEHSVKTGKPATAVIAPEGFFGYFGSHPDEGRVFDAAMRAKGHEQIATVLQSYDFSGFEVMCDVGGGTGHLLSAVIERIPTAKGVLFDLPPVIEAAAQVANDRLRLQAGDFFKDALPEANAYLLMEVLHDWSDAEASAILQAIRRNARPDSRVIIIENVVPENPAPHFSKGLDITMLSMLGGLERTAAEYETLLASAGFRVSRSIPTRTVTIVEAVLQ